MASFHKTKLRLQQLTGSATALKPASVTAGVAVASVASGSADGEGLLKYFAQAISNIHGNTEFGANVPGEFKYGGASGGLRALRPSDDSKIVLGGVTLGSASSVSGLSASNFSDSTISITATSLGLSGSPSYSLSSDTLVLTGGSTGAILAFRVVGQSSSAITVVGLPAASTGESLTGSDKSGMTVANAAATFIAYQNLRTDKVEGRAGLVVDAGTGALDMDGSTLDLDINNAGSMVFGSGLDVQAGAASEIGLSDGLLQLDLNGTDVGDGLLVDSEGSITLQAAHSSDGALILNAEGSGGVIQMQQQGAAKLLVSGSEVRVTDTFRVIDVTDSTNLSSGAAQISGGMFVTKKSNFGDDMALPINSKKLTIGADDSLVIQHRSSPGSDKQSSIVAGALHMSGTDAGAPSVFADAGSGLILSGSGMTTFIGGGIGNGGGSNFNFGGVTENGLMLSQGTDAADYITAFSNTTTILGALTSVKNSITSGDNTAYAKIVNPAVGEGTAVAMGSPIGGSAVDFRTAGKHQLDVYVNGQLLLSGTEAERVAGTADYTIDAAASNSLKFAFNVEVNDVVKMLDRQS